MTKGYHYQLVGARELDNFRGNAILADDMGLGKTFQALLYAHWNSIKRILVICPAGLKINWQREAQNHFGMLSDICYGRKPPRGFKFRERVVIINYEILKDWRQMILDWDPLLIIADEGHRFSNPKSQTYQMVSDIAIDTPKMLILTGTPITQRPAEFWPLLNMVDPKHWPNFHKFAWKYCQPRKKWGRWEYKGAVNLKHLHKKAKATCMVRRLKSEVYKDLPKSSTRIVNLSLSDTMMRQYEGAKLDLKKLIAQTNRHDPTARLAAMTQANALKQLIGQLKFDAVCEWIDNFLAETDRKLVVFGHHKKLLGDLHKRYGKLGVLINGTTSPHKRQQNVDAFQHQKAVRLFFGNMRAAGEGITLTAASDMAFIELPWVPKDISQPRARIERIGQTKPTSIYFLLAAGTIEERLCSDLQEKQGVVDKVLDGKMLRTLNLYNRLLRMLA